MCCRIVRPSVGRIPWWMFGVGRGLHELVGRSARLGAAVQLLGHAPGGAIWIEAHIGGAVMKGNMNKTHALTSWSRTSDAWVGFEFALGSVWRW